MPLKLPPKVKVGNQTYTLRWARNLTSQKGESLLGRQNRDLGIIEVDNDPSIPDDVKKEVVLHECLHALWIFQGLGCKAKEEDAVSSLAKGTMMLMQDNPKLRKFLYD